MPPNYLAPPSSSTGLSLTWKGIVLALLALGLFHVLTKTLEPMAPPSILTQATVALLTLLAGTVPARALHPALLCITRAAGVCTAVYLVAAFQAYLLPQSVLLPDWTIIPVLLAALSWYRPGVIALPTLLMHWSKLETNDSIGFRTHSPTDYVVLVDVSIFCAIAIALLAIYHAQHANSWRWPPRADTTIDDAHRLAACMALTAAGVHFSNYFYSAIEKIRLGGDQPLLWIQENPTWMLVVHAYHGNFLTLPVLTDSLDLLLPVLVQGNVLANTLVLTQQLSVVVFLFSLRAAKIGTVLLDLMHIAVFLLTGIFFWKWIILNIGFYFSFRSLLEGRRSSSSDVSRRTLWHWKGFCCLVVLVAPLFSFHIVRLGWFDTGAINTIEIHAELSSGETVRVPSNFFQEKSVRVAQMNLLPRNQQPLPTGTWGTTTHGDIFETAMNRCESLAIHRPEHRQPSLNPVAPIVRRHHDDAMKRSTSRGVFHYDAFPHHIWSNPWSEDTLRYDDLPRIASYSVSVRSDCVTWDDHERQLRRTPIMHYHVPLFATEDLEPLQ